jgi:hypothetical protein
LVIAAAALLALAYGVPYGSNNQVTYLLGPLQRAFPELYRHDWLMTETTQYHPVFAVLAAPLYGIDARGVVAFGIAQLAVMIATYLVIYRLVAAAASEARLAIFFALAGLLALGGGRALAGSYLFAGYLQPSSLATIGWLVAMVALAKDRLLVAGIALAAAGACHVNFLVLGIALFGAAELATRRVDFRRLATLLVPSLVVLAAFAPVLATNAHASDPDTALRVLVRFHAPGHYEPKHIRWMTPPLAAWLAIAWAVLPLAKSDVIGRLWRFAVIGVAACIGAVIVCSIPPLLPLTKLYVWRVAPFAQLACIVIALVAIAGGNVRELPRPRLAVLAIGAAVVIAEAFHLQSALYGGALAFAAAATLAGVWLRQVALAPALAVAMFGGAIETQRDEITDPPVFAPECGGADCELNTWIARATNTDAVFLVPPYMGWFRLIARRAVVADTQSPPLQPDELVAWYRRLCKIVGATDVRTHEELEAMWDKLDAAQLAAAAREFHAEYLLLDKTRTPARPALPVVFENAERVVYRLGN